MKTILLPTDFSKNALMAADFAIEHLSEENSLLVLAYVYDIPRGGTSGLFYLLEELQKQAQIDMDAFKNKLEERYPNRNFKLEYRLSRGNFAEQCNLLAKEYAVDAIVMGTKGASGVKEVLIGSNTVDLMRGLTKPLYVIPESFKEKAIEEVILSYDGKAELNPFTAEVVNYFAKKHHLPIRLLHVKIDEEAPIQNWNEIKDLFKGIETNIHESEGTTFEEGLEKATKNAKALMVMTRKKQTFWERFFNKSDSRKAVLHAELPMLIIPEK